MKIIIFICALFFSKFGNAEPQSHQQLQALFAKTNTLVADFVQTKENYISGNKSTTYGKIFLQKPNLLLWKPEDNNEIILSVKDGMLFLVDNTLEQVIINKNLNTSNNAILGLMLGNSPSHNLTITKHQDYFSIIDDDEETKIEIYFDNMKLKKFIIYTNIEKTIIKLKKIRENIALDSKLFDIVYPKDFEVIEINN